MKRRFSLRRKKVTCSITIIVLLFGISLYSQKLEPHNSNATSIQRHLGWWVDARSLSCCGGQPKYTPEQFFNTYFLTPPYPSGMLFATGINDSVLSESVRISWFNELASIADSYPAIKINILIFVNISDVQMTTSCAPDPYDQSSQVRQFILGIEGHSSVNGISYEGEYYGNTLTENSMFACWVKQAGYTFVAAPNTASEFPNSPVIAYCEFPWFQSMSDSMESCIYNQ